ncbi:MAG: 50S ribosomal protein L11 methyltransferase [Chloroflexota bacterium]
MGASWLEISLIVNGELAEAVAEVLARYTPGGVAIESTAVTANEEDEGGRTIGPLRVCGYLPVDEKTEEVRQKIEQALFYLGAISPLPAPEFRTVHEQDWAEAWKEHYHPIAIGANLIIVPAWLESPEPSRVAIRMDPGMAFGTGTHPTTQLCLELLEEYAAQASSYDVIDVGCGSGILSVAARKLGAAFALGVDIDPLAVKISQENAVLNGVPSGFEWGVGSVTEVKRGDFSIQQAPLVLANILAPIIVRLFGDGLADLVAPGGTLMLSGILDTQADEVVEAASTRALQLVEKKQVADWVALKLVKPHQ